MKILTRSLPYAAAVLLTLALAALWQDELSAAWDGLTSGLASGLVAPLD